MEYDNQNKKIEGPFDYIFRESCMDVKPIPLENFEIFKEQEQNSIFKIIINEKAIGTGFLCIIPFPTKLVQLPVLITCNHVLKYEDVALGKKINLQVNNNPPKTIVIDENRRTFTNNEYDITIIEIKEKDGFNINKMLEIDNDIDYESKLEDLYKGKSIYIIHYPYGISSNFSPGLIEKIENNNIEIYHSCSTENGSSGAPIINLKTFKVIGIHIGKFKNESFNCGNILKKPLYKFYIYT